AGRLQVRLHLLAQRDEVGDLDRRELAVLVLEALRLDVDLVRGHDDALIDVDVLRDGRPESGGERVTQLVVLLLVDDRHREQHDEHAHEHRDHVHVRRHPAFAVVVFLFFAPLSALWPQTHAAAESSLLAFPPLAALPGLSAGADAPEGIMARRRSPRRRGCLPACPASTPSMSRVLRSISSSERRFILPPIGSHRKFAESRPHSVATKALAIIGPRVAGDDRFSSTWVSDTTVPMMPMVGE